MHFVSSSFCSCLLFISCLLFCSHLVFLMLLLHQWSMQSATELDLSITRLIARKRRRVLSHLRFVSSILPRVACLLLRVFKFLAFVFVSILCLHGTGLAV